MLFRTAPSFKFKKLNSLSFLLHLEIQVQREKFHQRKLTRAQKIDADELTIC